MNGDVLLPDTEVAGVNGVIVLHLSGGNIDPSLAPPTSRELVVCFSENT